MNKFYEILAKKKLESLSFYILSSDINFVYFEAVDSFLVKGTITFIDYSILEFSERYIGQSHKYRFHYMDKNKNLIIRWDNVPHHGKLKTFPHHKHTPDGVLPSRDLNLIEVLDIAVEQIKIL